MEKLIFLKNRKNFPSGFRACFSWLYPLMFLFFLLSGNPLMAGVIQSQGCTSLGTGIGCPAGSYSNTCGFGEYCNWCDTYLDVNETGDSCTTNLLGNCSIRVCQGDASRLPDGDGIGNLITNDSCVKVCGKSGGGGGGGGDPDPCMFTATCGSAAKNYSYSQTSFQGSLCNPSAESFPVPNPSFPSPGGTSRWTCSMGLKGCSSGLCIATRESPPPPPAPTLTFTASGNGVTGTDITIPNNTKATLTWTSSNATSCTASESWSGSKAINTTASEETGNLTTNVDPGYLYRLRCSNAVGSVTGSVVVRVNAPAPPTATLSLNPNLINIHPTAGPLPSVQATWSSTNATICVAIAGLGFNTGNAISGSDPISVPGVVGSYTYSVQCTGPGGTISDSKSLGVISQCIRDPTCDGKRSKTCTSEQCTDVCGETYRGERDCTFKEVKP